MLTATAKQREAMAAKRRIVVWAGSWRSGKTLGMSKAFLAHSLRYKNAQFLISGRTYTSAIRIVLPYITDFLKLHSVPYELLRARGELKVYSNTYYIHGGSTERSQDVIQGLTLAGLLLDEAPLMPQSYVNQALGRLSVKGARAYMTLNKTSPRHWFKKEIVDAKAEDISLIESTLADAPYIDDDTRKFYENYFTGHYKARYVDNLWAAADGLVYENYSIDPDIPASPLCVISVDWGTASPTAALFVNEAGHVYDEYYYDGSKSSQRSPAEHALEIVRQALPSRIHTVIVDPSALVLKNEFERLGVNVMSADNSVDEGIQITQRALSTGAVRIAQSCENLVEELSGYVWDEKAAERGVDRPVKKDDHALDALRYYCNAAYDRRNQSSTVILG